MGKKQVLATAMVAAGAVAGGAQASTVSLSETLSLGGLLNGQASGLNFDFTSAMDGADVEASQIVSAQLVVYGFSDAQYDSSVLGAYGGYQLIGATSRTVYVYAGSYTSCSYSWWSGTRCSSYPYYAPVTVQDSDYGRSRDVLHQDTVADTLQLELAGQTYDAQVGTGATQTGTFGSWQYDTTSTGSQSGVTVTNRYYNRERDVYSGSHGALALTVDLNDLALTDLSQDGQISATFTSLLGQFQTLDATLRVELNTDLPRASHNAAVSEPGALALGLAALGAAGLARRRAGGRGPQGAR